MAKTSPKESVPPTMQPHQAIPLIRRQIERLAALLDVHYNDPRIAAWESTTESILTGVYGLPNGNLHPKTANFTCADSGPVYAGRMREQEIQRYYVLKQQQRKALLEAYVEQLQDLAPPAARVAPDQYRFHAEIERVSGQLYRDGHYKQAALEAYIRVIEEVKAKSGLNLDGDSLMNHALGCDGRVPAIQFNDLQTEAERDEQKGIMLGVPRT